MKKTLIIVSLVVLSLVGITVFSKDTTLEEKRTNIIALASEYKVPHLLILKDAPVEYIANKYKFNDALLPGSITYTDNYSFKGSNFQSFGLGATIYYEDGYEKLKENKQLETTADRVTIFGEEAFYTTDQINTKDDEVKLMYHELSFFKDNIHYLITSTYLLEEENKFDFLNFVAENVVSLY